MTRRTNLRRSPDGVCFQDERGRRDRCPTTLRLFAASTSTRQAVSDLSILDQRRQAKGYCASHGWEIVADYVDPGCPPPMTEGRVPAHDRRCDDQAPAFDVILVHAFIRFFRDQFQLEFYVRRLAKAGVGLVSITQEIGDDPMSNMIRQIMALFDEYQVQGERHSTRSGP